MLNASDFSENNIVLTKSCIDDSVCGVVLWCIRSRALCSFTFGFGAMGGRPTLNNASSLRSAVPATEI